MKGRRASYFYLFSCALIVSATTMNGDKLKARAFETLRVEEREGRVYCPLMRTAAKKTFADKKCFSLVYLHPRVFYVSNKALYFMSNKHTLEYFFLLFFGNLQNCGCRSKLAFTVLLLLKKKILHVC